jgi:hypothetical protein
MAARKAVSAPTLDTDVLVKLFQIVESFDSTEENPTGTTEIAEENGTTPTDTFNLLGMLADAELIDSVGRGLTAEWFISVPDVSTENAESVAREALTNFTPETPKPATKAIPKPEKAIESVTGLTREQVAEEVKTVQVEIPQNDVNFPTLISELRKVRENATNDPTGYVVPDEVILPPLPSGVNENTWDLAHNAFSTNARDTFTARLFWMERARDQFVA